MSRLPAALSAVALLAGCFEPVGPNTLRDASTRWDARAEARLDAAAPDAGGHPDTNGPPDAGGAPDASPTLLPCEVWACDNAGACGRTVRAAGVVCRPAVGLCDEAEICDGVSPDCPADRPRPKATYCGSNSWCDGTSTVCPPGTGAWETYPGSHFYWEYPKPTFEDLFALWVVASDDVWVGGSGGLLMHWDGKAWTHVPSGTTARIHDLWGPASDDLWAVGWDNTVLHWDGVAWAPVPTAFNEHYVFNGVWGASSKDLWVVGFDSSTWKNNGSNWPSGPGVIAHFDGQVWTATHPEGAKALTRVIGTSSTDVWAFDGSAALHWDGSAWTPVSGCGADAWIASGLLCARAGSAYTWTGTAWSEIAKDPTMRAASIWGWSGSKFWVAGEDLTGCSFGACGDIDHWDGGSHTRVLSDDAGALTRIRGASSDDIWAVGRQGRLLHWDGSRWTNSTEEGRDLSWRRVHGSSPSSVWALGGKYIRPDLAYPASVARLSSSGWELVQAPGIDRAWFAFWAGAENNVWVGEGGGLAAGEVARWDGVAWAKSVVEPTSRIWRLWAFSATDVWALAYLSGSTLASFHWDGVQWTSVDLGLPANSSLWALWGSSPSDLWAVGSEIVHWDGQAWSISTSPGPDVRLLDISGASSNDVWAVGGIVEGNWLASGYSAHWDGSSWKEVATGGVLPLFAVWALGPADVWASGEKWFNGPPNPPGTFELIHWDGASWSGVETGSGHAVADIWGSGPDDVWFAAGGLLHYKR